MWQKLLDETDDLETVKQATVLLMSEIDKLKQEIGAKNQKIALMTISQYQAEAIVTTAVNFREACKQDNLDDVRLTRAALFHTVDNYTK